MCKIKIVMRERRYAYRNTLDLNVLKLTLILYERNHRKKFNILKAICNLGCIQLLFSVSDLDLHRAKNIIKLNFEY